VLDDLHEHFIAVANLQLIDVFFLVLTLMLVFFMWLEAMRVVARFLNFF